MVLLGGGLASKWSDGEGAEVKKCDRSGFLYARPRGIFGVARFLDFGASFDDYNGSPSEADADARAIWADWTAVGDVIQQAIDLMSEDDSADKAA